jgi:hypothetical protein
MISKGYLAIEEKHDKSLTSPFVSPVNWNAIWCNCSEYIV